MSRHAHMGFENTRNEIRPARERIGAERVQSASAPQLSQNGSMNGSQLVCGDFESSRVVVLSITNDQGELFDPIDRVYEHCNSGAIDVKVSVTEQVIPHLMFSSNVLISCSHLMFSFHRHVSSHVATFR